jgi:TolA-binding protein
MLRQYAIFTLLFTIIAIPLLAQNTAWNEVNQFYKGGIELWDQGKYAAASQQFSRAIQTEQTSSVNAEANSEFSLLKENSKFYIALCALELNNSDAESLLSEFISKFPASNYTKLAYYHLGKSYFSRKNYPKTIEWLTKLEGNNISGKESSEYRYKLAYSYFELNNYDQAKSIFAELRNEKNTYSELSVYYYAYISYLQKDYKTALTEFERLKGSKPYESSYPYYISAMYFLDQRYDDVISYAIPILKSTRQLYETEMFRIVGASFFAKSDYVNAGEYYKNFQKNDQGRTQNNQDNYQIGYTWFKLKDYRNAIIELEKLETTDEYFQNGMIALGESFLKTDNKQGARSAFFKASRLNLDKKLQEEGLFNYAKLSYELDFHQVALDATQLFIKTYSYSDKLDEAKVLLGEILLTTKNYKDAIDILESIPNRNREANGVYQKVTYFRGLEYYNERAFQNGISMFMRSNTNVIDNEIHALSTYWLAEAMYEVRKFGESVINFEKFMNLPAARKTDVYNFAHYALAYAAFEHENYRKAATYFRRFLQGNEKDVNTINDAVLRLADSYFVLKDYGDALGYYDRIISYKTSSEDYAMFQRGMIQGLQGQNDLKIATHQSLLQQFPKSNYSDDAGFEIAYTYFIKGDYEIAKTDLSALIEKYPRSSYVPRALITIGLVELNQDQEESALITFKRVISEYSTTDEAKLALESIKNIYLQRSDAAGFLDYANSTSIGNLSTYEQDYITFQAANNRFLNGDYQGTFESVNAYFDKFPKGVHDKHAKYIRAESLVRLKRPDEAIPDYEYILNDWTSDYTERALMSIAKIYIAQKKFNEAIVHLKKLELTSEYKANYNFAVNNLMEAYSSMGMPDETFKYVKFIRESEKSSEEDIFRAGLYAGKANLAITDTIQAIKDLEAIVNSTQTVTGAEAKYILAELQYKKRDYKKSLASAFDLTNKMPSHDYWVAKTYILIADNYVAMKDIFQAKSTLQSIIENYENEDDDILKQATEKLNLLNKRAK